MADAVHRRRNPLNGSWVLVSPHRTQRPWLGQVDLADHAVVPTHDPACYLCAGNVRANGVVNPVYDGIYVFDNDFAAMNHATTTPETVDPLFGWQNVAGRCRVLCFSPDHALTLPELSAEQMRQVIDGWADQNAELGRSHAWVQIFENKGAMMGCSNPHPHGQIWASKHIPDEPQSEDDQQRAYQSDQGSNLLLDLAEREIGGAREILCNADWLAIVPWWAVWPFESLLLPRFRVGRIDQLSCAQRDTLGAALSELTARYDNLFGCSFPYSMGWHGAPFVPGDTSHWQLHAHFYPPLLRSATVRKFMVGYELLAQAQRDLTPEQAADQLRRVSPVHYKAVS